MHWCRTGPRGELCQKQLNVGDTIIPRYGERVGRMSVYGAGVGCVA